MKNTRIVISIVLVVIVCLGWFAQVKGMLDNNSSYKAAMERAAEYQSKGLYQKAIKSYEEALAIEDTQTTRDLYLTAYGLAYEDGVITANDYGSAMLAVCELYPENAAYWEQMLAFYLTVGDYKSAYNGYKKCVKANVKSDTLHELCNDVAYSFRVNGLKYNDFTRSPAGYYSIKNNENWGTLDAAGKQIKNCDYQYVGPYNADGQAVFVTEKDARLIGLDGVVEAIVLENVIQIGAYGNNLLPVQTVENAWKYLICTSGDYAEGIYEGVSNYTAGFAAVMKNGKWTLIDTGMQPVSDVAFDDVKLYSNMDYTYQDTMIASVGGVYGIYDSKGNAKNEFACKNADVYLGGYVAFQDSNGKWGFVNDKGEVVIEPQFDEAKSFSNGLAAVKVAGLWGFVNKTGEIVIDCQFRNADYFTKMGMCMVSYEENIYQVLQLRFNVK